MISEQERFHQFRHDIQASTDRDWLRQQLSVEYVEPKAVRVAGACVAWLCRLAIAGAIVLMCAAVWR